MIPERKISGDLFEIVPDEKNDKPEKPEAKISSQI